MEVSILSWKQAGFHGSILTSTEVERGFVASMEVFNHRFYGSTPSVTSMGIATSMEVDDEDFHGSDF